MSLFVALKYNESGACFYTIISSTRRHIQCAAARNDDTGVIAYTLQCGEFIELESQILAA
jgi:hypothetical protein